MPTFTYQARDASGRLVKGILEADSQAALADRLRRMGYLLTRVEEGAGRLIQWGRLEIGRLVSPEQLLLAVFQLGNLVEAGVPVMAALHAVGAQLRPGALRQAVLDAAARIEAGKSFSEALRSHPRIFPELMVSMARVGEASGKLDQALIRYADFLERDLSLQRAVSGSLTYPCLVLAAGTLLVLFVVAFVVPQFASLFAKAGLLLPLPTRILAAVGGAIRTGGWLLLLLGAAGGVGLQAAFQVPAVRGRVDGWLLRIPALGPILHQAAVARFARGLATLTAGGVPVLTALDVAKGVVRNRVIVGEVERVRSAVERGERIADTLSVGKVFHPDVIQMVRVGEESGRLDVMLEKAADFYDRKVQFALKQFVTLLEPALLIVLGGLVAFIMASLLLPMFDMVKVLQRGGIR